MGSKNYGFFHSDETDPKTLIFFADGEMLHFEKDKSPQKCMIFL